MDAKRLAAEKAVSYIKNGMVVGLGTGTTAYWAIQKIAEEVKNGLDIQAVASSLQTEIMAKQAGIPFIEFSEIKDIDIYIDGADEVDAQHNLIKGGGGALLREKVLAYNSRQFYVIVDESKLVNQLGKFPLPVEVVNFALPLTLANLKALGCTPALRTINNETFITDNGNLIIDCRFGNIPDPAALNNKIKSIPGVVETGLFIRNRVTAVIVGSPNGSVTVHTF